MPIETFEEFTHELTDIELLFIPHLVSILSPRRGASQALDNLAITKLLDDLRAAKLLEVPSTYKLTGSRIRKFINYIRLTGAVPVLVSNSKGYFVAETTDEFNKHNKSLSQRVNSISSVQKALHNQWQKRNKGSQFGLNFGG